MVYVLFSVSLRKKKDKAATTLYRVCTKYDLFKLIFDSYMNINSLQQHMDNYWDVIKLLRLHITTTNNVIEYHNI